MPTFESFEEIDAWKKSRQHCEQIYRLTRGQSFRTDSGLGEQIQRAAVSIPSNIAEGFERGRRNEFVQFLHFAKGSAGEVRTQLYIAKDLGYISEAQFREALGLNAEISKMLGSLIGYLQGLGEERDSTPSSD